LFELIYIVVPIFIIESTGNVSYFFGRLWIK